MPGVNLYIGPTLNAIKNRVVPEYYQLFPPVKQGDIRQLLDTQTAPGTIVVVDGCIEHRAAVSHDELCLALDRGWQVYGLGDMGAIRAYELRCEGMQGFGYVYRYLCERADCSDDEILWAYNVHMPDKADNEPLIHIRRALKYLVAGGYVSPGISRKLVNTLRQHWFRDRTLDLFMQLLRVYSPSTPQRIVEQVQNDFDRFRIKLLDFKQFIASPPWESAKRV